MVLDQSIKIAAGGLHAQDCTHESCLSPSLGWLSPTRISFSKDFSPHELEAIGTVDTVSIKATANETLQYKGKERSGTDVRDSMSEFEFAMAALECDQNAMNGNKHMLAADELFFKGKLLPLYVPEFISESTEHRASGQHQSEQSRCANRCSDLDKKMIMPATSLPHVALNYGALALSNAKTKELAVLPTSPKTPRCSTKLRELLGLKKSKQASVSSAATSHVSHDGVLASSKSGNASSKKCSKQRTAAMESKSPLSKAKRLFCRSDDGMNKVPEARSSTSEPLLLDTCGDIDYVSGLSVGCPVISFRPQHQAHHQQLYDKMPNIMHVAHNPSLCSSSCNQIARMQRSSRVSDHVEDLPSARALPPPLHQQLRVLKEVKNNENHVNARSSTSCRKVPIKEELKPAFYRGSRRPANQMAGHYVGSGESSPARRSSGAMSPAGSSGHWSPGRHSAGALMSGYNTACSSCRGSPGRHSTSGATSCYSPGRLSLGAEPPIIRSMEVGHGRLMRARSLERSSSYSPKSLQRKYDQMKAMRQREGWRPGLERSSSYNNMSSVRVAPVLNVPRVCSINRSSKNNAFGHTHSSSISSHSGGFALGHLLFSTKSHSSSNRAPAPKLQQSKQPTSSCRRRDYYY